MRNKPTLFVLTFLAPAVILYSLFVVLPLLQSFQISFYRWRGVSQNRQFVGLDNYRRLASDTAFLQALKDNLWLLVFVGISAIALGIIIAHFMQGKGRLSKFVRSVYLFPQAISLVVVAILWMFIFNPSFGLLSSGLKKIGLETLDHAWLGDPHTALPSIAIAFLWYIAGFYIMLFAAGLRSIPREVSEAANLDGAAGLRQVLQNPL